jgi:hypothetical protein
VTELRLCVGDQVGPRSTVWKVITRRRDVYIVSRMMGWVAKVSLHESGQGQFSFTARWVEARQMALGQRHLDRWLVRKPTSAEAAHVFRLVFPFSELKTVGPPKNASSIIWLRPPESGRSAIVEFYLVSITPSSVAESELPYPLIASLPFGGDSSLTLLHNQAVFDREEQAIIEKGRVRIDAHARDSHPGLHPRSRAAALAVFNDGTRGFIEIAPSDAAA